MAGARSEPGALKPSVARPVAAARRSGGLTLQQRESLIAFASLIPAFLLVATVIWYPVTQTLYHSFTDWNGARSTWVGWANYERIVSNGELLLLLRNNLIFVFAVPGILLISLVVTVLLFEEVPGWRFFRSVYYLPTILSAAVVGTLMRIMFTSRGAVNDVLGRAGWWNRLTRIIIPLLVPTIAYFVLINVIWIFVGLFGLVYTVTKGGPGYATTPFDLMIYRKAFESGEMGYASALSVILFLIVLTISAVQLRTFDRLTTDV